AGAAPVRGAGDGARELLVAADVRGDGDDLAGLHVGAEVDEQLGKAVEARVPACGAHGRRSQRQGESPRGETHAAIERFLAGPALSDGTQRAYRSDLRQFAAWLERRGLEL